MTSPRLFDLDLPDLALEGGGVVRSHRARGWWWGPETDLSGLAERVTFLPREALTEPARVVRHGLGERARRGAGGSSDAAEPHERRGDRSPRPSAAAAELDGSVPTVLLVHALTGDARAGGEAGWWSPLVGVGKPLDPTKVRLLCFNNLGSNYGSSGPLDAGWPSGVSPTTVDQARALWSALDALGVERLHLAAGGSLGGMILLAMAALRPGAIERLFPLGATAFATAWLTGFNHVQRQAIALDPVRGLEVARQLAMLTYRAEPGLESNQARTLPLAPGAKGRYRIEGYLEHQGEKLSARFDAKAYVALLDAMDSHDVLHREPRLTRLDGTRALVVDIDTDALYTPAQVEVLRGVLRDAGARVEAATLQSLHGHDAFLIEWAQLAPLVTRALAL
ncbi:MAG: alpha/beta fold hydrolase [Myxococcaceae bacterium]|jgi:homoserine O-acetyltransferase|nr:alpha/beta fold hydrolase [Myxococcaceae bacterium]